LPTQTGKHPRRVTTFFFGLQNGGKTGSGGRGAGTFYTTPPPPHPPFCFFVTFCSTLEICASWLNTPIFFGDFCFTRSTRRGGRIPARFFFLPPYITFFNDSISPDGQVGQGPTFIPAAKQSRTNKTICKDGGIFLRAIPTRGRKTSWRGWGVFC